MQATGQLLYALAEDAVLSRVSTPKRRAANLTNRIEQLGPVTIKLGQLMATTPGLISDATLKQQLSSRLHDRVRPQPLSQVLPARQATELSHVLQLTAIEPEPLGSASIAQVHKARANDGSHVAIKLVRPQAGRLIHNSFEALHTILKLVATTFPNLWDQETIHHTQLLLQDAGSMLKAEVDMATEFHNMQHCFEVATTTADQMVAVVVPRPLGHYLDGKALVMDYVQSQPLALAANHMPQHQRQMLAQDIAVWWLESILRHQTAHGDPHIGNWGLMDSGKLVLYDYGNVVQLESSELQALVKLLEACIAILTKLPGAAYFRSRAQRVGKTCGVHILDWETFEADLSMIIAYLTAPGAAIQLDKARLSDSNHKKVAARLSGNALRLVRSLLLVDGVCRSLDRQFAWRL